MALSNKDVGVPYTDPFEWFCTAFLKISMMFFIPYFLVMTFVIQVISYVFGSIIEVFSSKAGDSKKIAMQPVGSNSGIEAYPGWCFVVIVMILGMFSFFLFETPNRKAAEQGQAEAQISLGKIYQDCNGVLQDKAERAELKSFALAAAMPLNQAIAKQFSKFDYQIVQDNLKVSGLYLGPINGVWGRRSQNALADLKRLMMAHGNECTLDDISLIATIIKTSEETLSKAEAVETEDVKNANAIFATERDKNMFWENTKLNNEERALTWADDKCVAKKLFDAYWENHKTTAASIDLKSCGTQSAPAYNSRIEMVRGYYRANGTYVEPYYRTRANSSVADNWSAKGNVNPFTGKRGSKNW